MIKLFGYVISYSNGHLSVMKAPVLTSEYRKPDYNQRTQREPSVLEKVQALIEDEMEYNGYFDHSKYVLRLPPKYFRELKMRNELLMPRYDAPFKIYGIDIKVTDNNIFCLEKKPVV